MRKILNSKQRLREIRYKGDQSCRKCYVNVYAPDLYMDIHVTDGADYQQ
jgi:hypothetical protein